MRNFLSAVKQELLTFLSSNPCLTLEPLRKHFLCSHRLLEGQEEGMPQVGLSSKHITPGIMPSRQPFIRITPYSSKRRWSIGESCSIHHSQGFYPLSCEERMKRGLERRLSEVLLANNKEIVHILCPAPYYIPK